MSGGATDLDDAKAAASIATWDVQSFVAGSGSLDEPRLEAGQILTVVGADVVTSGPELARLTGNVATVHHDAYAAGGSRLVYGGHAIGLALHQVTRAIPDILAVVGWHSCDHVGPVHEQDTLVSSIEVERLVEGAWPGRLASLRVRTSKLTHDGDVVLDWRPIVVVP